MLDVICACGSRKTVLPSNVAKGDTRSCGCLHRKRAFEANVVHGARSKKATSIEKRLLSVWRGMNQRCRNPNARNYKWYGGKGVRIEWASFAEFYEWAVTHGYKDGLELDRVDPSLNYSETNCIWSTKSDNLTRAHLDIDKALLVESTLYAKENNLTLSAVIEEALGLLLDGRKGV